MGTNGKESLEKQSSKQQLKPSGSSKMIYVAHSFMMSRTTIVTTRCYKKKGMLMEEEHKPETALPNAGLKKVNLQQLSGINSSKILKNSIAWVYLG